MVPRLSPNPMSLGGVPMSDAMRRQDPHKSAPPRARLKCGPSTLRSSRSRQCMQRNSISGMLNRPMPRQGGVGAIDSAVPRWEPLSRPGPGCLRTQDAPLRSSSCSSPCKASSAPFLAHPFRQPTCLATWPPRLLLRPPRPPRPPRALRLLRPLQPPWLLRPLRPLWLLNQT
jgi:hypothetical protein